MRKPRDQRRGLGLNGVGSGEQFRHLTGVWLPFPEQGEEDGVKAFHEVEALQGQVRADGRCQDRP